MIIAFKVNSCNYTFESNFAGEISTFFRMISNLRLMLCGLTFDPDESLPILFAGNVSGGCDDTGDWHCLMRFSFYGRTWNIVITCSTVGKGRLKFYKLMVGGASYNGGY